MAAVWGSNLINKPYVISAAAASAATATSAAAAMEPEWRRGGRTDKHRHGPRQYQSSAHRTTVGWTFARQFFPGTRTSGPLV
jgi:hypothetical protein